MTDVSNSRSQFTEDTLIAIHKTLNTKRWSKYQKRSGKQGCSHRLTIAKGHTLIPLGTEVDCLFMLGAGVIRMVPSPEQMHLPLVDYFHGSPTRTSEESQESARGKTSDKLAKNLPIIGARYYFTRRRASFAYVAETACSVYAIDSDLIVDIGTLADTASGDHDMFLLMRETLINSDIAEHFVADILMRLGINVPPIESEFELLSASESIRDYPVGPRLIEAVSEVFEARMKTRIKKAEDMDLEPSIFMA
jgi:hypothetical protein